MNTAFTHIASLLVQALDTPGTDKEQDTFTLELGQWLCYMTFPRAYVVLWDYHRTGNWEVCISSHIPHDMAGFFMHTLYFKSTLETNESLSRLLSILAESDIGPLGYEVHEDDGPTIEFATASPLNHETQMTIGLLPSPHHVFNVSYFTSYEQYQTWRKEPQLMEDELKPLFMWQKLTGRLIYESKERPHTKKWDDLLTETQAMFDAQAKLLNKQLSLCSQCGERVPLWDGVCVGGCNKEIFDAAQAIREYTKFMKLLDHDDMTPEEESELELLTIQVKRQGLRFYYDHKQHIYDLRILKERHD